MKRYILLLSLLSAFVASRMFSQNSFWEYRGGPATDVMGGVIALPGNNIMASASGSVYRSSAKDVNWKRFGSMGFFYTIVADGNRLLGGSDNGIFLSSDTGATWKSTSVSNVEVHQIAIGPDNYWYAATYTNGVYRSTDRGQSWAVANTGITSNRVITVAVAPNGTAFAGCTELDRGVYRSTDHGATFQRVDEGWGYIGQIVADANGAVYVAHEGAIHRSTDNGTTWKPFGGGDILFIDRQGAVFTSTDGTIAVTRDGGTTWKTVMSGALRVYQIAQAEDGSYFAATAIGVMHSTDGDETWKEESRGELAKLGVLSLTADRHGVLYAGTQQSGGEIGSVHRSTDGGKSWTALFRPGYMTRLTSVRALSDSVLIAGSYEFRDNGSRIYRSTDAGASWSSSLYAVTSFMYETNDGVLFTGSGSGFFRSDNLAQSWSNISSPLPTDMAANAKGDLFLLAASSTNSANIYRSTDKGASWQSCNAGMERQTMTCIAANSKNTVFAGTSASGLFSSKDDGTTWSRLASLPPGAVRNLIIDSMDHLFVNAGKYIYRSADGGASWEKLALPPPLVDTSMVVESVNSFLIDRAGYLYVGTSTGRVFRSASVVTSAPAAQDAEGGMPAQYALDQNYPNPFNPSTTISFSLPERSHVSLKIFDVMGRDVATIVSETLPAGKYSRAWNALGCPSGVYFYRLQAGSFSETKRLLLLK